MPLLKRLPLGQRINLLAAMSVLAVLLLALTYILGEVAITRQAERELAARELSDLAKDVELGALQMRRREKDFLLRKDMKYAEDYEKDSARVLTDLRAMAAHPAAGDLVATTERVADHIEAHREVFRQVVALEQEMGLTEEEGLKGALRAAVHNVEERLKAAGLDPLTVKMLMMRRHEKDYMLRRDPKYIARIDERAAEFAPLLAAAGLPASDKSEIAELMAAYVEGVKAWAGKDALSLAEAGKLSSIFSEMQPDLEAIFAEAATRASEAKAAMEKSSATTEQVMALIGGLILLLAIAGGLVIGRSIRRPIARLTGAMQKLAEGDLEIAVPEHGARDEIGAMAETLAVFRENAVERRALEAKQAEEVAAREARAKRIEEMIRVFERESGKALTSLNASGTELNEAAQQMSVIAEDNSKLSVAVAAGAREASMNVQTVASASEELTASIGEISGKVTGTADVARQAVSETEATGATMATMEEAAQKIGDVVTMIEEIAEQTNLLALNATIEAARAGDAGKGFAVVASEVKSLATQTGKATGEISQLISAIQTTSKEAVAANGKVRNIIAQISEMATAIASAIEEQTAATQEITANVHQAAQGTEQVTDNIAQVEEATARTKASAETVGGVSGKVNGEAANLNQRIGDFIKGVRAA